MTCTLNRMLQGSKSGNRNITFKFKHHSSSLFSPPPLLTAARCLLRDCPHGPSMGGDDICACYVMSPPSPCPGPLLCQMQAHPTPSSSLVVPTLPTVQCKFTEFTMSLTTARRMAPPTHTLPHVSLSPLKTSLPYVIVLFSTHSTLASPLVKGCGRYGELLTSFYVWFKFINHPMQP